MTNCLIVVIPDNSLTARYDASGRRLATPKVSFVLTRHSAPTTTDMLSQY